MKKKSEICINNRLQIRRSSLGGLNEVRSSTNCSDSRVSRETPDMRRVKRVRFADPNTIYPLSCKPDASSIPAVRMLSPRSEDPKTSEYTFYKKLREDAGHNFVSYPLHKQFNQLKKLEPNNVARKLTNKAKHNYQEIRSFLPLEKVTPTNLKSSPSPPGVPRNTSIPDCSKSRHEEVFSSKRHKLLKWAAETSSLDIDEYHSKGYDLVSVLLQRLITDRNTIASNWQNCMASRSRHIESNTKSQPLSCPETDVPYVELPQTPSMNFSSPIAGRYLENSSLECWSKPNNSREIIFSQWDNVTEPRLTGHASKTHLQYEGREPYNFADGGRPIDLHTISQSDSMKEGSLGIEFSFSRDEYLELECMPMRSRSYHKTKENFSYWDSPEMLPGPSKKSRVKEFDEVHDTNESVIGREGCTQLLGWEDVSIENELDLCISSHNAIMNLNPWRTSGNNGNRRSRNYKFDATGLCFSPVLSIRRCPDFTLWDLCSESHPIYAVGRHALDDKDYQVVESDHSPVTLSCTSNYLPLSLDALLPSSEIDIDFRWKGLSITDFFGEPHSSTHPSFHLLWNDIKHVSSSLLTGDETESCLALDSSSHTRIPTQFAKDAFDIHDFSSFGFKISRNDEMACPLLLDESSWDGSKEISWDSNEDK